MSKLISGIVLSIGLAAASSGTLSAQQSGADHSSDGIIVTRNFTGIWEQVDQQSQGLALQVVEQWDDSRKSVVYWFTYGADRKTAWFVGIGDLVEDRIEFELFETTDVGFMQDVIPGFDPARSIGHMTIDFDSCDNGVVTYETDNPGVGSGSFAIRRLLEVMNTHCSGGISDDMHADGMFGEQRLGLVPAREGITGNGYARYEDYPGHMEFEAGLEGLPDGDYHLYIGMQDYGEITVQGGRGVAEFASPGEDGKRLMTFDPRGLPIEIYDDGGLVLSSFENRFDQDGHHGDEEHHYDCGSGPGMPHGAGMGSGMGHDMTGCVDDGEYIEIKADLENTGVLPSARGDAEWRMNAERVEFSVEIENLPVGAYTLKVGGIEVGIITAFTMHGGEVYGHLTFRDPAIYGREPLDFEPRGQKIEVLTGDSAILEATFPVE